MDEKKRVIGIDLGTTNSEVAVIVDGKPVLLKVDGHPVMPSVVSIGKEGDVLIGQAAVNNELVDPEGSVRCIKRKMGRDEILSIHGKEYTPSMLSSLILTRLKKTAEDFYGELVTQAVITVPAFFNEKQREATKLAGEMAGLEVLRLLNEPTAAALAYSLGKKEKEISLVYDLGGGTFDVSIVDLSLGVMEVLASDGDTELGGSDFDLMIAQKIKSNFLTEHGIDLSKKTLSWLRVLRAAEEAKIRLSTEAQVDILEEFIEEKEGVPIHLKMSITRVEFEEMIRAVLDRTIQCVKRALKQASCEASSLDRVVLVGGSTYIPLVSQLLEKELGIAPQAWLNPETVVAQGAAVEGASLSGESLGIMMLDVTPHSLGLRSLDSMDMLKNVILIHRNTSLPCVASRLFYKQYSEQDIVEIIVYQGESSRIEAVTEIGRFNLEGLEESEDLEICVKFEMDRSGLLNVTATDIGLGKKVVYTIERKSGDLTASKNLADLKALRLQLVDTEAAIETVGEEVVLTEQPELLPLSEELIKKALAILEKGTLASSDVEELKTCIEAVKSGESSQRLEEILYYLD